MNAGDKAMLIESMRNDRNPNPQVPAHAEQLLEETCQRTGLDWKLRHVYLINRGGKWAVTVSIDGFRLVANQDPEYSGQDGPYWTLGPDQPWTDIPPAKVPYAAKVGVIRNKGGQLVTTWGVAKYDDYNARSPMWTKFASTMVAKCAEMLALRKALPGKLGGLYGVEEMDQAAESARNSKSRGTKAQEPVSEEKDTGTDTEGEDIVGEWSKKIQAQGTLEGLKALGVELSKSSLGLPIKQQLSLVYNGRKKELGG